jgi:hypothetical protein
MRENLESPLQQCLSLSVGLLLASHLMISVHNNKYTVIIPSNILDIVLPPHIGYLSKQYFFLGLFPSLGNFHSFLNP